MPEPSRAGVELRRSFAYCGTVVTRRQKQIVDFIRAYATRHGFAPTLEEIGRHLRVGSVATVHKHLRGLEARGVIRRQARRSRALELVAAGDGGGGVVRVPLLGRVSAGRPIEPVEQADSIALPDDLLGRGETFALRVTGDSMIEDGILDGDVVIVESRPEAANGATVVALVRGEATVKRLERREAEVRLLPANAAVAPIVAPAGDVEIRGVVVGLLRRYR